MTDPAGGGTGLAVLRTHQAPDGAFASLVHRHGQMLPDRNAFVTGLVLRCLWRCGTGLPEEVRERALDFLLLCRSADGAFGFWPRGRRPPWLTRLPDDADDTAIAALELARNGRLDRTAIRRLACTVLVPARLARIEPPAPPWLREGAFRTWLRPGDAGNPVDCCVNANVVALLAYADLRHLPGYAEACRTIESGLAWAGGSPIRLKSLSPFYPHPRELLLALRHAVERGASELVRSAQQLEQVSEALDWESADEAPICGSAYGGAYWTSDALDHARRIERSRRTRADRAA